MMMMMSVEDQHFTILSQMTLSGHVVLCSRDMGRRREIRDSNVPSREFDSLRRSHGFGMNLPYH